MSADLLARARAGDGEAFGQLVDRYRAKPVIVVRAQACPRVNSLLARRRVASAWASAAATRSVVLLIDARHPKIRRE
jgi:hypothetical protein